MNRIKAVQATNGPSTRGFPVGEKVPTHQRLLEQFLELALRTQTTSVARHQLPQGAIQGSTLGADICVWIKKAGPRNPQWRYTLLGVVSKALRIELLTPVPNLGGREAIAKEAQRLTALREAGLRVPQVLAVRPDGLMISDLALPGQRTVTIAEEIDSASLQGAMATLRTWRDGLLAIASVHSRGAWLSQAFARNLVRCNDGEIGFIDFEDDPASALSIAQCQARDWFCYLHSTALSLRVAGALDVASPIWRDALKNESPEVRKLIAQGISRMSWMRRLPHGPRSGRDVQRVQAAAEFLTSIEA